jgi:hypothetical protein
VNDCASVAHLLLHWDAIANIKLPAQIFLEAGLEIHDQIRCVYAAKDHALELRAQWSKEAFVRLLQGFPPKAFQVSTKGSGDIYRSTVRKCNGSLRFCNSR